MATSCREIITLQTGHYSNFIGTHWWNIQHSSFEYKGSASGSSQIDINHDFLFREGCLPNGDVTYTPRLLIIDAKGTLGSLQKYGMLYDPPSSASSDCNPLWDQKVELIDQLPQKKNEYLKALEEEDNLLYGERDEDKDVCYDDHLHDITLQTPTSEKVFDISKQVNVWSDFLRPHLHPNSIHILRDVWHEPASNSASSWGFQGGATVLRKEECHEEITDKIRILAESCENLQGFHLLSDSHNGMGGVSWILAQHIADEYSPKDLFSFLSTPPHLTSLNLTDVSFLLSSLMQCFTEMSKLSSMVVPINLKRHSWHTYAEDSRWPFIQFEGDNAYLSSSILSSFLDTVTLPYRKKSSPLPMAYVADLLTPLQRKCVSGGLSLPLGIEDDSTFLEWIYRNKALDLVSLTGGCDNRANIVTEYHVLRGISNEKLASPKEMKWKNAWEFYKNYLQENGRLARNNHIDGIPEPMKIAPPFPHIFKKEVQDFGFISQASKYPLKSLSGVNLAAALYQGNGILNYLEQLFEGAQTLNVSKIPRLFEENVDHESWNDVLEDMRSLLTCYGSKLPKPNCDSDDDD